MFEVIIINKDESKETYDILTATQAECIFRQARQNPQTAHVELNEYVD